MKLFNQFQSYMIKCSKKQCYIHKQRNITYFTSVHNSTTGTFVLCFNINKPFPRLFRFILLYFSFLWNIHPSPHIQRVQSWQKLKCNTEKRKIKMRRKNTDKKENQIFLIYKKIQNGAVAKSYMTNGLLIYGEIFAHFLIY
jgi:hypothetical protein